MSTKAKTHKKVYLKREFKPEKEPWYPRRERLAEKIGEQRYLAEVLNPFRQIMGDTFPQSQWKSWDRILLIYSPTTGPDSLLEETKWGTEPKGERQPV